MPFQILKHAKVAMKWSYLASGMAKWGKWNEDTTSFVYVAYSAIEPGTIELIYQMSFTAYAMLHIVLAVIAFFKKRHR